MKWDWGGRKKEGQIQKRGTERGHFSRIEASLRNASDDSPGTVLELSLIPAMLAQAVLRSAAKPSLGPPSPKPSVHRSLAL